MCAVPNMAVFCSSLTSWFPGIIIIIFIIIIIIIVISFVQGIYTYIPETNYVPREYSVAAILFIIIIIVIIVEIIILIHCLIVYVGFALLNLSFMLIFHCHPA